MSTVRKLAELAGVSIATVSRALRGDPHVHPATRERVLEVANRYHYRPNRLMQSLVTGKSGAIGCVVPFVANPYSAQILRGVLAQAFAESYHVIVLESEGKIVNTRQALRTLVELRVEGILLDAGHTAVLPTEAVWELWSHGVELVSLDDSPLETPVDQVLTDEERLAQLAIDYLTGLGHRHIAYVGPVVKGERGGRARAISATARRTAGIDIPIISIPAELSSQFQAAPVLERLLALDPRPTAVIGWEDHIAARLMLEAQAAGMRVPVDLSVLGCGNQEIAEYVSPRLTSIEQFPELVGKQAVLQVLRQLADGPDRDHARPETHHITPSLIERASCSPPASR